MITLYAFGTIFPEGRGETKDLWVQWVLEEVGLHYQVHALDHTGGELDSEFYSRISPFRQAPIVVDDGFVVAESAAVALYLAEKACKLIPSDVEGRTGVIQWCFAAVATVYPIFTCIDLIGMFDKDKGAPKLHEEAHKIAGRWLGDLEYRLEGREWIAGADFTVAEVMMAGVLRMIRKTDLLKPFPRAQAYYERCFARPPWQRTLTLCAQRLGVIVDDIR